MTDSKTETDRVTARMPCGHAFTMPPEYQADFDECRQSDEGALCICDRCARPCVFTATGVRECTEAESQKPHVRSALYEVAAEVVAVAVLNAVRQLSYAQVCAGVRIGAIEGAAVIADLAAHAERVGLCEGGRLLVQAAIDSGVRPSYLQFRVALELCERAGLKVHLEPLSLEGLRPLGSETGQS